MTLEQAPSAMESVRDILLSEYDVLKAEQRSRIVARDRLMYATLAALAAMLAASIGAGHMTLLLLLPPVCLVLGWTYLVNDETITAIGDYILAELGPRLARTVGSTELLVWESSHRLRPGRFLRKSLQLAVDLVMFVLPTVLSVVGYWVAGSGTAVLLATSAVELAAAVVLGVRIVCSADLSLGGKRR